MNSVESSQKNEEIDQDVSNKSKSGTTKISSEDHAPVKRSFFGNRDACDLSGVNVNREIFTSQEYLNRVQYAFKLGFSEAQLKIALSELGTATPKDNDLLQELIKLGTIGKSIDEESDLEEEEGFDDGDAGCPPKVIEKPKNNESNLRTIVIDGSNVAMR
jgi:hypothetical protein